MGSLRHRHFRSPLQHPKVNCQIPSSRSHVQGAISPLSCSQGILSPWRLIGGALTCHPLSAPGLQALPPETLIPMTLAGPEARIVLCGDPRQLGPAVRSGDCQAHGLATSLLEGWAAQYGSEADSWQQQGRAPPMCELTLPTPQHVGCTQCCTKQGSSWSRAGQHRADPALQQGQAFPYCEPGL